MKKLLLTIPALLLLGFLLLKKTVIRPFQPNSGAQKAVPHRQAIRNGDLIFQISKSSQSKAIQLATHSKYSHLPMQERVISPAAMFESDKLVTVEDVSL